MIFIKPIGITEIYLFLQAVASVDVITFRSSWCLRSSWLAPPEMPPIRKPREIVRIEYNAFGEREKVKKVIILDPRSNLRSQPTRTSDLSRLSAGPPSPICKGTDDTATRLEHTINILQELLLGKIARDAHAGMHCSMIDVAREYFRVAFGATEVGKEKMATLAETINELQGHSSFLRTMGRSLMHSQVQNGLGPGESAVFFSVWSLLVERSRTSEEDFAVEMYLPLGTFIQIFCEACNRHLSIPPTLQEITKRHIMERSERILDSDASTDIYHVDDLLELSVEALESSDRSCLETESLLFSKSALPQNLLLPNSSNVSEKSVWDGSAKSESMLTSLRNIKLLLDELILHDEDRNGILPAETVIHVLVTWQTATNGSKGEEKDKSRLVAQCFAIQEDEESDLVDYIELIAFAHERIVDVTINSIEDLLDAVSTFERGLDCGTYRALEGYVGGVILDRRRGLGLIVEDRIKANNVRASKTPKSYASKSITASSRRQTKTPIYLTEQQLYSEK